jgi:TRAP-type uncharacterized transport system substrate-binding protein
LDSEILSSSESETLWLEGRAIPTQLERRFYKTPAAIAVLIVTGAVLLWVLFVVLRPLPGRDLTIVTGPEGSAYAQAAEHYREILARHGVRLHMVSTDGAVGNLERLRDLRARVDAGFVQAGTTNEQESPNLESLGTLFYEPLWIFCRCTDLQEALRARPDAQISIGPKGGATHPLALRLLRRFGVDVNKLRFKDSPPEEAANQLIGGDIDLVAMLTAWDAPVVQRLLHTPGIEVMVFKRADALVALDPHFSKLILPAGIADFATNRPPIDVPMIASKASLVVRNDLHPALKYLLLQAAIEVHSRPSIFQHAGEFPAAEAIDLPLSSEAQHMYKSGPSILQRTLPFWLAELVQRALVILLPIAAILYPLWSLLPRFYRWQMQRRIYRLYGELRFLEVEMVQCKDASERDQIVLRMEELERRVLQLKMPRSFSEMTFNLRRHIREFHDSAEKAR